MIKKMVFLLCIMMFVACEEVINEVDIKDENVTLLAPANDVVLSTGNDVIYTWQQLDEARNYRLQVATPNFESATDIKLDILIDTTTYTGAALDAGIYEWRVKALNNGYKTEYFSNKFTVEAPNSNN